MKLNKIGETWNSVNRLLKCLFRFVVFQKFATMETWRSNLSSLFCDSLACIMIIIVPMFTVSAEAKDQPFSSLPTLAQLVQFVAGHPYLPSSRMNNSFSAMVYPDADTCFFSLRLPTIYSSYDEFRKALNTAITCQHLGYGRVKGWGVKNKPACFWIRHSSVWNVLLC